MAAGCCSPCASSTRKSWSASKDEQKKKLGVVARHYDRLFYKLDGYGYLPHERRHLWMVDARTGKAKQLTDHAGLRRAGPGLVAGWQMDRFHLQPPARPRSDTPTPIDLFVMPCRRRRVPQDRDPGGRKNMPSFSPDGRWIAYYGPRARACGTRTAACGSSRRMARRRRAT